MFLYVYICLCKPVLSQCVFCLCYMIVFMCKPSIWAPRLHSHLHTHIIACCTCVHINPIHCLYMLFACPCIGRWVCPSFCLRCWPKPHVCHGLNNIFPEARFPTLSWAITVIAIIIKIILTLVPLFSRKGLTLNAIYADWLDRPGIPKVWRVLLSFGILVF